MVYASQSRFAPEISAKPTQPDSQRLIIGEESAKYFEFGIAGWEVDG
jgi:hypothetical protein